MQKLNTRFIYLLGHNCANSNHYKFGQTGNLQTEIELIQSYTPIGLKYFWFGSCYEPTKFRMMIAEKYKDHHIRNQWYNFDTLKIKDVIASLEENLEIWNREYGPTKRI